MVRVGAVMGPTHHIERLGFNRWITRVGNYRDIEEGAWFQVEPRDTVLIFVGAADEREEAFPRNRVYRIPEFMCLSAKPFLRRGDGACRVVSFSSAN
ncbi:hypothetical protein MRB53_001699 [Persea americana]|uniref:Uncharacterized protein n=1 Tax=Persea americana TaxID=3435 RepID=A0ACC2MSL3_PERAE|nr:hypothetical protein MRB53_001699 [Persea americana]